jgi:hypothetical protein
MVAAQTALLKAVRQTCGLGFGHIGSRLKTLILSSSRCSTLREGWRFVLPQSPNELFPQPQPRTEKVGPSYKKFDVTYPANETQK